MHDNRVHMSVVCVIEEKEGHDNNIPCVLNVKIWVVGLKLSIKGATQKGLLTSIEFYISFLHTIGFLVT